MSFQPVISGCSEFPFLQSDHPFPRLQAYWLQDGHCWVPWLTCVRRGCAAFAGRDVSKLKGKGGGKFKYMSEKDMLEMAAKFAPYRYVYPIALAST